MLQDDLPLSILIKQHASLVILRFGPMSFSALYDEQPCLPCRGLTNTLLFETLQVIFDAWFAQ